MENESIDATKTEEEILHEALKKRETEYLDLRDKLAEQGPLLDKHQKTVEAAKAEATAAAEEWKSALRTSGGDISKSIRELKRQEIAARETAEEFSALVKEIEPQFHDLQQVVCHRRSAYIQAFYRAERLKNRKRLDAVAEALFSTDQGIEFLDRLFDVGADLEIGLEKDQAFQEMARAAPLGAGISGDEFEKIGTSIRYNKFITSVLWRAAIKVGFQGRYHYESPIAAGPYELDESEARPLQAKAATTRLMTSGILQ